MQNVDTLIGLVEEKVKNNIPVSPAYWVEMALRISTLIGDVENEVAVIDAKILSIEAELIKQDMPAAKAKILARNEVNYEDYLIKKAKLHRADEFIKLAKKRSAINEM